MRGLFRSELRGFHSTIACIGYFCHSNLTFLILITIDVRGFVKLVQAKKFIVHPSLGRIESVSYGTINDNYGVFPAMRLRF